MHGTQRNVIDQHADWKSRDVWINVIFPTTLFVYVVLVWKCAKLLIDGQVYRSCIIRITVTPIIRLNNNACIGADPWRLCAFEWSGGNWLNRIFATNLFIYSTQFVPILVKHLAEQVLYEKEIMFILGGIFSYFTSHATTFSINADVCCSYRKKIVLIQCQLFKWSCSYFLSAQSEKSVNYKLVESHQRNRWSLSPVDSVNVSCLHHSKCFDSIAHPCSHAKCMIQIVPIIVFTCCIRLTQKLVGC